MLRKKCLKNLWTEQIVRIFENFGKYVERTLKKFWTSMRKFKRSVRFVNFDLNLAQIKFFFNLPGGLLR